MSLPSARNPLVVCVRGEHRHGPAVRRHVAGGEGAEGEEGAQAFERRDDPEGLAVALVRPWGRVTGQPHSEPQRQARGDLAVGASDGLGGRKVEGFQRIEGRLPLRLQ
eukprot:14889687-Alexandrium_andersonii.AAC.1